MKRYWKLFVLILITVLTISTFYIQSSLAMNKLPKFNIEHINGDPEELKKLIIEGYYVDDDHDAAYMEIDKDGTKYDKPSSYIGLLSLMDHPDEIKSLQKRYRNFMRDKQENINGFFENDEILIYANVKTKYRHIGGMSDHKFTFEIEKLDKQTKKKDKFSLPVPKQNNYNYLDVINTQLTDSGHLKVFTINSVQTNHSDNVDFMYYRQLDEMHIYTFDLDKQMLIDDDVIDWSDQDLSDLTVDIFNMRSSNITGSQEYIIYDCALRDIEYLDDGYVEEELLERKLIAYHVNSGEHKILQLSEELETNFDSVLHVDSTIYFMKYESNEYQLVKYNVNTETVELTHTFTLKPGNDDYPNVNISEDRIYAVDPLTTNEEEAYIQIGDINSGEWIYEGKIEIEQKYEDYNHSLNIYNIRIAR